ncbi:MAG: ABC transporter ATP-binding protein [Gammaproteobacteria bacterium]|nr:MAG: ABC transporter ATP-binding protein [Gammaproteobacteria bacterium]
MPGIVKQIYALLSAKERIQFLYVVLAALIMTVFELIGIGTIVAFMGVLAQPELVFENRWLSRLYNTLGFGDAHQFIMVCGFALLLIYLLRNLFAAFVVWLQLRFVWDTLLSLSQRLLEKYIYRPYHYFLTHNTSEIQKNLLSEMGHIVTGVLMPATRLITQSTLAGCILVLLFWNDPVLAGAISILFGGAYTWIYIGFRQKLSTIGARRVTSNKLKFKSLSEVLSGIKEERITGREEYFIDSYIRALRKYTRQEIAGGLIIQLPKYLIESLAFGGILGITLYTVGIKQTMGEIIPVVTLYAIAAYRMLPAFQEITRALSALRVNRKSLDIITRDLALADDYPGAARITEIRKLPITCQDSIKLQDVSFRYPTAETNAVEQMTLTIQKNTSVGLVGPTGAGKSTVADIVLGLLIPQSGQVEIDQTPITVQTAPAWQIRTGYVPQQIFLADDTVTHNIAFGVNPEDIDHEAVTKAARTAHIYEFVTGDLPEGFNTLVGERGIRLSGGQRQRIAIARALYHKPELLIFDEATSALDGATETTIRQSVRELAGTKTLLIIAHRLNTVKDCDVIHVLEHGKIIASGNYEELMEGCDTFRAMAQASAH